MMKDTIFPLRRFKDIRENKAQKIITCLKQDCRISLTGISKATNIPLSTVFQTLTRIKEHNHMVLVMEELAIKKSLKFGIKKQDKIEKIIKQLKINPMMKLTDMSKNTKIPVSTLFDCLIDLKKGYDLKINLRKVK